MDRDERKVKGEIEVGARWLPVVGNMRLTYERLWDGRSQKYRDRTLAYAGRSEEDLQDALGRGDGFADVYLEAGRRAVEDGDEVHRNVLSKLVAAALNDSAKIHEISYLLDKLSDFKALHIRLIVALPNQDYGGPNKGSVEVLAASVGASVLLVDGALSELESSRFAVHNGAKRYDDAWYALGPLGEAMLNAISKVERRRSK